MSEPTPGPAPSPSSQPKHGAPDVEKSGGPTDAQPTQEKRVEEHKVRESAQSREGEGAPGDISGVFTSTENARNQPGDFSHLTGRNEHDEDGK